MASHKGRPEGVMSTHQEAPVEPAKSIPAPTGAMPQAGGGSDSKANEVPK